MTVAIVALLVHGTCGKDSIEADWDYNSCCAKVGKNATS